jgi:DNA invertase Pin-like site-specific DNA recombinase
MIIRYARVSTDGQTRDAQESALKAAGAERVFAEKISGAVTEEGVGEGAGNAASGRWC